MHVVIRDCLGHVSGREEFQLAVWHVAVWQVQVVLCRNSWNPKRGSPKRSFPNEGWFVGGSTVPLWASKLNIFVWKVVGTQDEDSPNSFRALFRRESSGPISDALTHGLRSSSAALGWIGGFPVGWEVCLQLPRWGGSVDANSISASHGKLLWGIHRSKAYTRSIGGVLATPAGSIPRLKRIVTPTKTLPKEYSHN